MEPLPANDPRTIGGFRLAPGLPEAAVWRLAAGLAEALQAVRGCGLAHRDLKPGNVQRGLLITYLLYE